MAEEELDGWKWEGAIGTYGWRVDQMDGKPSNSLYVCRATGWASLVGVMGDMLQGIGTKVDDQNCCSPDKGG